MTAADKEAAMRAEFREWYCRTYDYRMEEVSDAYLFASSAWSAWQEATRRASEREAAFVLAIVEAEWSDDACMCPFCGSPSPVHGGEHAEECIVLRARAAAAEEKGKP